MRAEVEIRCARCGVLFVSRKKDAKYCSHSCANAVNSTKRAVKLEPTFPCPNNEGVDCCRRECHRCGWDPEVAKMRLNEIKRKMGVHTWDGPLERSQMGMDMEGQE